MVHVFGAGLTFILKRGFGGAAAVVCHHYFDIKTGGEIFFIGHSYGIQLIFFEIYLIILDKSCVER